MRARLKLYVNDDQQQPESSEPSATMSLEDFARVISDAVTWDRSWLQDFADEQIHVSQDLYELIRVYDEIHKLRA